VNEIEMERRLSKIETQLQSLSLDMQEICKAISGNGDKGLSDQVLLNTERITNMQKAEEKRQEFWQKVTLAVIGMLITNLGVIIMLALGLR